MRAEAPDVHLPDVHRRLAGEDPLGHHLADPAGAGESVGAEPGGDKQAAHVALAETELVVRGERLRSVDQLRDRDLIHHGHAPLGVIGDLLEPLPVLLEQAAVEVRWDAVDEMVVKRPRRATAFVAAHDQSATLFTEVDEVVRVT